MKDMFHGFAPVQDGLFILHLDSESVYNINVKRLKPNDLNMTYFGTVDLVIYVGCA